MYIKSLESIFLLVLGSFARLSFIVLSSRLTKSLDYGKFAILWSFVLLTASFSTLNIQQVIIKYYNNKLNVKQVITNYFSKKGIKSSFIFSSLFLVFSFILNNVIDSEVTFQSLLFCFMLIFLISFIDIESAFKKASYNILGYYLDREILPFFLGIIF